MAITFDPANKRIILDTATVEVSFIYSEWKRWVAIGDNAKHPQALQVVGGDPLGGGLFVSSYFFLTNNWKVRPMEANHTLTITGNLTTIDGSDPIVSTLGNYRVLSVLTVPVQAQAYDAGGGGGGSGTAPSATEIANAVWNKMVSEHTVSGSFGEYLQKKLLSIGKFLSLK